jgi:hypothetical protein
MNWNSADAGPGIDMELSVVLHASPEFFVRVSRVRAHENSITFHLDGGGRASWPEIDAMREGKEHIAITVRFADGHTAGLWDSAGLKSGLGPVITARGGWVGGRRSDRDEDFDFDLTFRVWPLPSNGPMTLTAEWPGIQIGTAEVTIDGERAQNLASSLRKGRNAVLVSEWSSQPHRPQKPVVPSVIGMEMGPASVLARRSGFRCRRSGTDAPHLVTGVIVEQQPPAGTTVEPFTNIKTQVRDDREDPPGVYGPRNQGGGGQPPGGVREPRRPLPGSDEGLAEATP